MLRIYRIVLVVLLLVSLPLRSVAGGLTASCDLHHGGVPAGHEHVHDVGKADSHHDESGGGEKTQTPAASACSVCASCCAGASLVPGSPSMPLLQQLGFERIGFVDRGGAVFLPERLDRPPLAS